MKCVDGGSSSRFDRGSNSALLLLRKEHSVKERKTGRNGERRRDYQVQFFAVDLWKKILLSTSMSHYSRVGGLLISVFSISILLPRQRAIVLLQSNLSTLMLNLP